MKFKVKPVDVQEYTMLVDEPWAVLGNTAHDSIIALFSHYAHAEVYANRWGYRIVQVKLVDSE